VNINAGDMFVINTRLYWHQTEIPASNDASISFARDIYLDGKVPAEKETMINKDGAWAVGRIEKGTLMILTQNDGYDAPPMRRTKEVEEANCKLVEAKGNEKWAILAIKDIEESEFFMLLEEN
jgi:hypothetical protein